MSWGVAPLSDEAITEQAQICWTKEEALCVLPLVGRDGRQILKASKKEAVSQTASMERTQQRHREGKTMGCLKEGWTKGGQLRYWLITVDVCVAL